MGLLVAAVVTGFLAGRLLWVLVRPVFSQPVLQRTNHRGRPVPVGAGIVLPAALLLVEGARAVADAAGLGTRGAPAGHLAVLAAAAGFSLFGAFDDLAGEEEAARGFRGHLAALAAGQLTTGGLKLVGGAAVALAVVAAGPVPSFPRLLADAALVALAANLGNLLDRAPGRATKAGFLAFVVLGAATGFSAGLLPVAVVMGASLGLLLDDLHEHLMLGDAGSNALGAVLGLGVVLSCAPMVRNLVLVGVAALNAAAEVVSFSEVINAVPPLRTLDRAGRRMA